MCSFKSDGKQNKLFVGATVTVMVKRIRGGGGGEGGRHLTHFWVEGCRWGFETVTLFRTK